MPARNASPAPTAERVSTSGAMTRITPAGLATTAPSLPMVTATISALPSSTSLDGLGGDALDVTQPATDEGLEFVVARLDQIDRNAADGLGEADAGAVKDEPGAAFMGDAADPREDVGSAAGGHAAACDQAVEAGLADCGDAALDLFRRDRRAARDEAVFEPGRALVDHEGDPRMAGDGNDVTRQACARQQFVEQPTARAAGEAEGFDVAAELLHDAGDVDAAAARLEDLVAGAGLVRRPDNIGLAGNVDRRIERQGDKTRQRKSPTLVAPQMTGVR